MKGGYDSIVAWTAKSLAAAPDTIRLDHPVTSVNWHDNGVKVSFESNNEFDALEADALIVIIPLGLLHQGLVDSKPELPAGL